MSHASLSHFLLYSGVKNVNSRDSIYKENHKPCGYYGYGSTVIILLPCAILFYGHIPKHSYDTPQWTGRTLLDTQAQDIFYGGDIFFIIGYVLGWISAVIYFFALPPQIVKNVSF